jgi:hypothetical protein
MYLSGLERQGETTMTISAILSGLALFSIAFECYVAASGFLALAFYLIGHGA